MITNREAIYTALFNLLKTAPGFKFFSRRMKMWTDVPDAQKPCLIMFTPTEQWVSTGLQNPQKTTLDVTLFIYTIDGRDPNAVPIIPMNNLCDAVGSVLLPSPVYQNQTLGGLVSNCWIEGEVYKEPGDLDGDGLAMIPVKILVP